MCLEDLARHFTLSNQNEALRSRRPLVHRSGTNSFHINYLNGKHGCMTVSRSNRVRFFIDGWWSIDFACTQALAGPVARDLASDVSAAKTNLARWDVEINSLESRLNIFNDEISITITGVYNDIKTNLAMISVSNIFKIIFC